MLPLQRQRRILAYLAQHGSGTVAELAEICHVSDMTVRRDLVLLEKEQTIQRTHGGAVYVDAPKLEMTFEDKESFHRDVKDRIALCAVKTFVHNGLVISLEGGTTVTAMARHLDHTTNLTILTNGLRTAASLERMLPTSTVMCSGGTLRDVSHTLVGPIAEQFFERFHAQVAFLSAIGMTLEQGLMDADLLESQAKRAMSAAAARRVVLLDSTKIGRRSFTTTLQFDEVDALITDDGVQPSMVEEIKERGVDVIVAP
jgi:DeoR/GlpR family transcriptional regulator of sugar metabolism